LKDLRSRPQVSLRKKEFFVQTAAPAVDESFNVLFLTAYPVTIGLVWTAPMITDISSS
jgi:hypothetical protein